MSVATQLVSAVSVLVLVAVTVTAFAPPDWASQVFITFRPGARQLNPAVSWKLAQSHARTGRVDFSNKEIRLDSGLKLPDIKDNLEARLILLRRRLEDRCEFVKLTRPERGQIRLELQRRLTLEHYP